MKIILLGKNGQIGWELRRSLLPLGEIYAFDSKEFNLANEDNIRRVIRSIRPNLIINAAAYTAVDKAEEEEELCFAINSVAPKILAKEAKLINAGLIHYSTDYVFDGTKKIPYTEEDKTNPLNIYGKSKLQGESNIRETGIPYLILRTSWVYGTRGKNFLLTMLRLAKERKELSIVNDQIGSPTSSRIIAETTALIIAKLGNQENFLKNMSEKSGIYNVSSSGETSWFEFAKEIFVLANNLLISAPSITPIRTTDYKTPAPRPLYSVLSKEKLKKCFNISMPDWKQSLNLIIEEILLQESYRSTFDDKKIFFN